MTNNKSAVSFHSQPKGRASHSTLLIALKMGDVDRAMRYYENGNKFESAADLALTIGGLDEAAILYERQIQSYEKAGDFDNASRLAKKINDSERAEELAGISSLLRFG